MLKNYHTFFTTTQDSSLKDAQNQSISEAAQRMGIGENLLYKWRSEQKEQLPEAERQSESEPEALRKQVKQLENERDILKKALLIFSRAT